MPTDQTTTPADAPPLRVVDVTHRYDEFVALRGVHLAVERGAVHCLLGPSGSGKSTLLRLIAGLEELQHGSIELGGTVVAQANQQGRSLTPPERRPVGFVFQDYALFPHLDVQSNVAFGMRERHRKKRRARVHELLDQVGMAGFAKAMPHTLSGGQQQRVALVRALARNPSIMLLDEPFSGLDVRLRAKVRESTLDLLRAAAVATVVVTHDPREAQLMGDAVSVLEEGVMLPPAQGEAFVREAVGEF